MNNKGVPIKKLCICLGYIFWLTASYIRKSDCIIISKNHTENRKSLNSNLHQTFQNYAL